MSFGSLFSQTLVSFILFFVSTIAFFTQNVSLPFVNLAKWDKASPALGKP
jgi:hypothetical protein